MTAIISSAMKAYRASILHFTGDPTLHGESAATYLEDGLLVIDSGKVFQCGEASALLPQLAPGTEINDYRGKLIVPGFVDTHIHFAQTDIIASNGAQVLEWLEKYAFPAERRFADPAHADEVAAFSLDEMLRNGTTTSMVFSTVHKSATEALFRAAEARGVCMIAGKVMMDRNCPAYLQDTAESSYQECHELIERWHRKAGTRLHYAVTPRFAPTSSEAQLAAAGKLLDEFPGVYLQSHLAENRHECAWVQELFPWSKNYLDVYEHFGLMRSKSVFAHCIYLNDNDRKRLAGAGAAMSFCPTSNLFLGSGLFDADAARKNDVKVGLGTDVGGGTSFSILRTLHEAYKVLQLNGQATNALQGFYDATLGGATALSLEHEIGNFARGKCADFVVLNPHATPLIERRIANAASLADRLFAMMMLGDEHMVDATYVQGNPLFSRAAG